MNIFDIIGPVMVGPSSSHTAGAVRIGRMARALLGQGPVRRAGEKSSDFIIRFISCNRKGSRNTESFSGRTSWHGTGRYTDSGQLKNCSAKRN